MTAPAPFDLAALMSGARKLEKLADADPEVAQAIREKLRPHIEYRATELHHEAALAKIAAEGPDCEFALEHMGRTAATLPGYMRALENKLLKAVGQGKPRRKALWVSQRESARQPSPCKDVVG